MKFRFTGAIGHCIRKCCSANLYRFTCWLEYVWIDKKKPKDLVEATSCTIDLILIAKDYNGAAYLPEFGFNGIGSLEPGIESNKTNGLRK